MSFTDKYLKKSMIIGHSVVDCENIGDSYVNVLLRDQNLAEVSWNLLMVE